MPLGWGIISTGQHPDLKVAPAMTAADDQEIVAVYSRDKGRAQTFAKKHGAAAALNHPRTSQPCTMTWATILR